MIAFQNITSGRYISKIWRASGPQTVALLADAFPWHQCDEERLRREHRFLVGFRTVTYSSRIDHPSNDLAQLSREELAERYPIERTEGVS